MSPHKNLATLKYFLGIEVARSKSGIVISGGNILSTFLKKHGNWESNLLILLLNSKATFKELIITS